MKLTKTKIFIRGDQSAREALREKYLHDGDFAFDRVIPMPASLDINLSSTTTTGYDALHGNWRAVANYWIFKAGAEKLGHPFPLQSREALLASLEQLDNPGVYTMPGQVFHDNLQRYGFGWYQPWRKKHWASVEEADVTSVEILPEEIFLSFIARAYPKPVVTVLSKAFPTLELWVIHACQSSSTGKSVMMKAGKITETHSFSPEKIHDIVFHRSSTESARLMASEYDIL